MGHWPAWAFLDPASEEPVCMLRQPPPPPQHHQHHHCLGLREGYLGLLLLGARTVTFPVSLGSAASPASAPRAPQRAWAMAVLRSLAAQWSLFWG